MQYTALTDGESITLTLSQADTLCAYDDETPGLVEIRL